MIDKADKPYILLSTERAGSTPAYEILNHYFSRHFGTYGVGEILNPVFGFYSEEGGRIAFAGAINQFSGQQDWEAAFSKRCHLVRKHHGRIFFKVFPSSFRGELEPWLLSNFNFCTMERRDVFQQLLSFLISSHSGIWYVKGGMQTEIDSILAHKSQFDLFEKTIVRYQTLKRQSKAKHCFFYEDFLSMSQQSFLAQAGFINPIDDCPSIPDRQNLMNKLDVFKNPSEVVWWYRDSWLNTFYPLPSSS